MKGSPFHARYPDKFKLRAWLLKGWMKALTDEQLLMLTEWNVKRLVRSAPGSSKRMSAEQALTAIENEQRRRPQCRQLKRGNRC